MNHDEIENRPERNHEDFIPIQEQELDFTLVYPLQENQNHSTDETVRYQPGIYSRKTNIIQETTELTIPRDRSAEFNRREREKENLDIYLSSSANFTCVNTSGNT